MTHRLGPPLPLNIGPVPSLHAGQEHFVHDPALAWDMAYAEKPYRELELNAKELKLGHVATEMAIQATNAGESARLEFQQPPQPVAIEPDKKREADSSTIEKLKNLVANNVSFVSAYTHELYHYAHIPGIFDGLRRDLSSRPRFHQEDRQLAEVATYLGEASVISPEARSAFVKQGVSEVVTVGKINEIIPRIGSHWAPAGTIEGKTHVLIYETLRDDRYFFPDTYGRGGNSLTYKLLLSAGEAIDLGLMMQKNPNLARHMGNILLEQQGLTDAPRPPYGAWRANNGGVNHMAFRPDTGSGPDQSTIVKF